MPIYKVFSILTLSFLYRPLVYNLLDNKFGRRISFLLLPLYSLIFYASSLNNVRSYFLKTNSYASANYIKSNNYFDLLKENEYVKDVAISSKIINTPYVTIFIPFEEKTEDLLLKRNKDLKPEKTTRGIKSSLHKIFSKKNGYSKKRDSIYGMYLMTFNDTYSIKIDNSKFSSDFLITKINKQLGFQTVLPLKKVNEGKHLLSIRRKTINKKTKKEEIERVTEILFWYYKNK